MIVWIQADEPSRQNDFPPMFKELIQLDGMPVKVLKETVLKEYVVGESKQCLKVVTDFFCQQSKGLIHTKIISLGGNNADGK